VRDAVAPGGVAVVNALIEGTTYLKMFGASPYCLFAPGELTRAFTGWNLLLSEVQDFAAPNGTVKRFETVIAAREPR
jgi:tellurite methyltransferase